MNIWDTFLVQPLANGLIVFYKLFFGNMGLAIVGFTAFLRILLIPLTLPSLRATQKMRELAPHLEKIKKKHKGDRAKLSQAQMELYKQKGVNPAAGCLPQIIQIVILIALFRVFLVALSPDGNLIEKVNPLLYQPLKLSSEQTITTKFLGIDLTKPDVIKVPGIPLPLPGALLILAALVQFLSSKMLSPEAAQRKKEAKKTRGELDDVLSATSQQMLYLFPLMTIFIGYTFPSGLVLYWFVFSLFQALQQYAVSGWGGLSPWIQRVRP